MRKLLASESIAKAIEQHKVYIKNVQETIESSYNMQDLYYVIWAHVIYELFRRGDNDEEADDDFTQALRKDYEIKLVAIASKQTWKYFKQLQFKMRFEHSATPEQINRHWYRVLDKDSDFDIEFDDLVFSKQKTNAAKLAFEMFNQQMN